MKLNAAQTKSFLAAPTARIVLLFGPDQGLVSDRAKTIAKKSVDDITDPFCVAELSGADLQGDPAKLYDEMAALSLTGGRRLVWIKGAQEYLASAIASLLEDLPKTETVLLLEGGDLDRRSKLRALCEGAKTDAAAIACYTEEGAQRQGTIGALLESEGFHPDRKIIQLLSERLPEDRAALKSEIEKLALYAKGEKEITEADLDAILAHAGTAEQESLALAVGAGDAKKTGDLLDVLFAEQASSVALLRAVQRHFLRLQYVKALCDQGFSAREAAGKLTPKLFWKTEGPFLAQLAKWSSPLLAYTLERLFEVEAQTKRTGAPAEALTKELLLLIAKTAK